MDLILRLRVGRAAHQLFFVDVTVFMREQSEKREMRKSSTTTEQETTPKSWSRARKIFSVPVAEMSRGPFSGRIFFLLGRNRAPRLKSLGAKKRSYHWDLLHTPGHEHHQWNDSKFLFFLQWKSMKKKKKKKRKEKKKKLPEGSWAHFILMKPWVEGVGVVE